MDNDAFKELKASVKEGAGLLRVSDERVVSELIKNYEIGGCFSITSDQEIYELLKELQSLRKHKVLESDYLQTIDELRKENTHLLKYVDKLIEPLDYLPKDIELIRSANFRLHEVEKQNKLLREDAERLTEFANGLGIIKAGGKNWICAFCNGEENSHTSDCVFGNLMKKHNALMEKTEAGN